MEQEGQWPKSDSALCSRGAGSATQVLPPYRTRFSKHQFTSRSCCGAVPDALRRLDLSRSRDALARAPRVARRIEIARGTRLHHLYRFLRRLDDVTVERGLGETVRRLRRRRRRAVSVAIDGTGLSYNSVSTFFIRRLEQHADRSARHRHWLKWVIVVDVQQQILLAQRAHQGPGSDVRSLPDCWTWRHEGAPFGWCWRMAEFDSEAQPPTHPTTPGSQKHHPRQAPRYSPRQPSGIKCSAPFRKNRTANAPRSKPSLGDQTQAFLPRSRAQLIYTDSPSPAARSCLQPLSLEASPHLGDVNRAINTCKSVSKQRTLTLCRINTYQKTGRGYPSLLQLRQTPVICTTWRLYPCGLTRLRILPVTTGCTPQTRVLHLWRTE